MSDQLYQLSMVHGHALSLTDVLFHMTHNLLSSVHRPFKQIEWTWAGWLAGLDILCNFRVSEGGEDVVSVQADGLFGPSGRNL